MFPTLLPVAAPALYKQCNDVNIIETNVILVVIIFSVILSLIIVVKQISSVILT
jgi:hypothetical protein